LPRSSENSITFVPVILTASGKSYGPECDSPAEAQRQMAAMVSRHIRNMPLPEVIAKTKIGVGVIHIGGATFRIERGGVPL
jgi:hypothetical protein